jgi:hypothetical protein
MSSACTMAFGQATASVTAPAPEPHPMSAQRLSPAATDGSASCSWRTNRYVSGPKNTESAAVVGYAEWKYKASPIDETRTVLCKSSPFCSITPACRMASRMSGGRTAEVNGLLQPNTHVKLRAWSLPGRWATGTVGSVILDQGNKGVASAPHRILRGVPSRSATFLRFESCGSFSRSC